MVWTELGRRTSDSSISHRSRWSCADSYACALSRRPNANPLREPETPVAAGRRDYPFPWAASVPVSPLTGW